METTTDKVLETKDEVKTISAPKPKNLLQPTQRLNWTRLSKMRSSVKAGV